MTGSELTTAIAATLGAAVVLGWVLHWLWCLLARMTSGERGRIADLVHRLHEAEEARETLAAQAQDRAEMHAQEIATLEQALAEARAAHAAELAAREAELDRQLRDARREAEDAWSGLGSARRRIGELEQELAGLRGPAGD